MTTSRLARALSAALIVLAAVVITGVPTSAAPSQEGPPTTVVPPLPDEADPLTAGISPVMWQACNGAGLAVGLIVLAGTLAGVPPEVAVPLNDAIVTTSGPVLLTFFEACQQIPLPEEPPDCGADQNVPLLPSLGRPIPPAALLANELRALDTSLDGAGVPLDGALGDAADDLLACAAHTNPEPDVLAPGSDPGTPTFGPSAPPTVGGGGGLGSGGTTSSPGVGTGGGAPAPAAAGEAPAPGVALPIAQPVRSSAASTGTGLALALLALLALAALGWIHAGNPRAAQGSTPAAATS